MSYRDVEEVLAERGITVDHVTIYRWVQTFTPEFVDAARPARHAVGDRWFLGRDLRQGRQPLDLPVSGVDQHGQVIDVLVSTRRAAAAAGALFTRALRLGPVPVEVITDRAPVDPRVLDEFVSAARQVTQQYVNNRLEADHGRLKARLRPMRGLKTNSSWRTVAIGHALLQNRRRGRYALTADLPTHGRPGRVR